jgi:OmpA-OmpF porin, OOP family
MHRIFFAAALFCSAALAQTPLKDYGDHKDPALFTRLPNFFLVDENAVTVKEFDSHDFQVQGKDPQKVEGKLTTYNYTYGGAAGKAEGAARIIRNYQNAALRIGGKVVYDNAWGTTIKIDKGGKETWVEVSCSSNHDDYELVIVEKVAMQQDVVANAEALKGGIAEDGHAIVSGIFFDTAKSEVKPESEAALKEVVKFLQANPSVKVWVVGHTDSVGTADSNVALSNARAASVIKALAQMGIAAARMAPHGAGPFMPVASNKKEEGRARNRRVELVEQ